jgi:hypothetical protein
VAGRIAYYQKMGVAHGVLNMVKHEAINRKLDLHKWETTEVFGEKELKFFSMTVVIPTPSDYKELLEYPMFTYNGKSGVIDMLNIQDELSFHIMLFDYKKKEFINGYWHSVREGLSLEDTCTLFEYVEDRQQELVILPFGESGKYNSTGTLGIGI